MVLWHVRPKGEWGCGKIGQRQIAPGRSIPSSLEAFGRPIAADIWHRIVYLSAAAVSPAGPWISKDAICTSHTGKTAGTPSRRAARRLAHTQTNTHAHSRKACLHKLYQRADHTLRLLPTEERLRGKDNNLADLTCLRYVSARAAQRQDSTGCGVDVVNATCVPTWYRLGGARMG
jgi:hypothetical protein